MKSTMPLLFAVFVGGLISDVMSLYLEEIIMEQEDAERIKMLEKFKRIHGIRVD